MIGRLKHSAVGPFALISAVVISPTDTRPPQLPHPILCHLQRVDVFPPQRSSSVYSSGFAPPDPIQIISSSLGVSDPMLPLQGCLVGLYDFQTEPECILRF
ncbi:hypothetical protein Tco_0813472 [Tanacetum coccineum]